MKAITSLSLKITFGISCLLGSFHPSFAYQNRGYGTMSCKDFIKIYANQKNNNNEDILLFEEDINGFINGYNEKTIEDGEEDGPKKIDKTPNKEITEETYEVCLDQKTLNFTTALMTAIKEENKNNSN